MDAAEAEARPLELEKFLPYRLAVLSAEVSRGLSQIYARQFQLSVPEWRIIANLGRFGPLNAGDLAERSSLDKPKVTRALQKLEARNLVQRAVEAHDRRQVRLTLTRRGRGLLGEIAKLALDWERQLVASLTREDRAALDRVIATLVERARSQSVKG
jgi:DNA-binding MarR family transcriptional regulator